MDSLPDHLPHVNDTGRIEEEPQSRRGLVGKLRAIEQKHPIGIYSLTLALILGFISYLAGFGFPPRPSLSFVVESNTTVLDDDLPISRLEFEQGQQIEFHGKALRLIVLRIINDGEVDILTSHYDPDDLLGVSVGSATFVERPNVLATNSDYIRRNFRATLAHEPERSGKRSADEPNVARFKPLILDRGDYLTIKMVVTHDEEVTPTIAPVGKVAGIGRPTLAEGAAEPSFLSRAVSGSLGVQVFRLFAYSIGLLIVLIVIIVTIAAITGLKNSIDARVRRRKVESLLQTGSRSGKLATLYVRHGEGIVRELERIAQDKEYASRVGKVLENRRIYPDELEDRSLWGNLVATSFLEKKSDGSLGLSEDAVTALDELKRAIQYETSVPEYH